MVPGTAEEKIYVKSVDWYLRKSKTNRSCVIILIFIEEYFEYNKTQIY